MLNPTPEALGLMSQHIGQELHQLPDRAGSSHVVVKSLSWMIKGEILPGGGPIPGTYVSLTR